MSTLRVEEITKLDGSPFFPDLSPFVLREELLTGSPAFPLAGNLYLVYDANLIYLPANPSNGSRIAFSDLNSEFAQKPITLLPATGSGHTIGGGSSLSLSRDNQAIGLIFWGGNWVVTWDAFDPGANEGQDLELTPVLYAQPSLVAQPGNLYLLNGTTTVNLPPGQNNDKVAFADFASRFGQPAYNVTILPASLQTIGGSSSYLLDKNNEYVEFIFRQDRWVLTESNLDAELEDGDVLVEGFTFPNDGLKIQDALNDAQTLTLSPGENLTADRVLTLNVIDNDRELTLQGDATLIGTNTGDQDIELIGDITGGPSQGVITTSLATGVVGTANLANVNSQTVLGRTSAGVGPVSEVTFQSLANNLGGTGVGDLVQLEDIGGGVPGLPAVDASQLVNLPPAPADLDIFDEGNLLTSSAESIDFVGQFLTATTVGNAVTVTSTAGDALTTDGLDQFALTSSAALATVITDETGTGSLVFGTAPTINNANLTGVPTAPTATPGTNTTQVATTAFVTDAVSTATGGSVSGTGVDNQVAIWSGSSVLEGDVSLTFDTSTDTLGIGASGNLAFGGVTVLDDNAGTMTLANIDALDATTEATIEDAIDTLPNLTITSSQISDLGSIGGGLSAEYHNTATLNPPADQTIYLMDTTATAITVTLPASPANGFRVAFADYAWNFGTNACTINVSGGSGHTLANGVLTTIDLDTDGALVQLAYWNNVWVATGAETFVDNGIGGGGSGGGLTIAYHNTATLSPTDQTVYQLDTGSNAITVTLPSAPANGTWYGFCDYDGTFATNNVTINRSGTDTIINGTDTSITLDSNFSNLWLAYYSGNWSVISAESFVDAGGGQPITNPVSALTWSSGATMDNGSYNIFSVSVGATGTLAHSNVPSGVEYSFRLYLTWTAGSITWPTSWTKGMNAPTATGDYIISGTTIDGGTSFTITVTYQ